MRYILVKKDIIDLFHSNIRPTKYFWAKKQFFKSKQIREKLYTKHLPKHMVFIESIKHFCYGYLSCLLGCSLCIGVQCLVQ